MEARQNTQPTDHPIKVERSGPIPLADRRRLIRAVAEPLKPGQIYTDWASI